MIIDAQDNGWDRQAPPAFAGVTEQLEWEMEFFFGQLLSSDWADIRDLRSRRTTPDRTLTCFVKGDFDFIWAVDCEQYSKFGQNGLELLHNETPPIIKRNIDVCNFIFQNIDQNVAAAVSMNDVRFFDWRRRIGSDRPLPVFQHHRRKGTEGIIFPLPGYHSFPSRYIPALDDPLAFRDKLPKVVWRGGLRGTNLDASPHRFLYGVLRDASLSDDAKLDALMAFPRFRLAMTARNIPELDVGYTIGSGQPELNAFQFVLDRRSHPLTPAEQIKNRYLLALDGNDWPSSLYWSLNTNSLVFRQNSHWEAFGDNFFQPWEHYVPVEPHVEDILSKFKWAEENISECERMISNAHEAWKILFNTETQMKRRGAIVQRYNTEYKKRFGV